MNDLTGERIGFVVTGSFCTFSAAFAEAAKLRAAGAELTPIFSEHAAGTDTRFGKAADRVAELEEICGRKAIRTIPDAEPLGPKNMLDLLVVAPCTANTAAKLAYGITDNTATMAVKSMLRRQKPVVLAVATNDALGASAKNIGLLLNTRHYYFVPLRQDAPREKPTSLVADKTIARASLLRWWQTSPGCRRRWRWHGRANRFSPFLDENRVRQQVFCRDPALFPKIPAVATRRTQNRKLYVIY